MAQQPPMRTDGTVAFLPHRLNRHPVVVRGLTADELWMCCGLSALLGLLLGGLLAVLFASIALVPTSIVGGIALGVWVGGGFLRRQKRGRPETWLYRHLQWRLACNAPLLAGPLGAKSLITWSGHWSNHRSVQ
ncbi:conjugative transfer region protein [Delftia tsuruhatensis]|uniref:TIGR03750 family conjugal transfer protein n=1 Tax=Delftia tsuruhatensis TaxID=180282 RepID=UPI001E6E3D00|nr:TIGR03750 family conjugal transfer protein [Delftia tsuruhatensis]CAB5671025.1 conjugative transfer region protein [Delftia tsuruhatensis]CAC9683129.1 conjugative transfer region protein [Delftia tsuruhatensis]